jgi:hypothetical protein
MNDLSDREQQMIAEWTRSTIDAAVYAGLIQLPWRPAEHVYGQLHGYYTAGLTHAEGAEVLFATRQ